MSLAKCQKLSKQVFLYDTTLRDGAQKKGISFSLEDKLKIARLLNDMGVSFIEGGWPGSNPKDMEFFKRVKEENFTHSKVVAFGSTRRSGIRVDDDINLRCLIEADTDSVALVGKSSVVHVEKVLGTTRHENLKMIKDSVSYIKSYGREVIFDAEHFFDGFKLDKSYALECLEAACAGGADWIVLCDTNGGSMPSDVSEVVEQVTERFNARVGIHAHNDCELAVANSIAAVEAGALQVQGTVNGYGERCGNTNLISLAPTLQLKLGFECLPTKSIANLTNVSRSVSEIANLNPDPYAPYVGSAAFAHKAGLHASAVAKLASSYEHMPPETVGNTREILVSELAGRGNLRVIASNLNFTEVPGGEAEMLERVKKLETKGYKFEDAKGSVELMMRRLLASYQAPFQLLDMFASSSNRDQFGFSSQAVVKLKVSGQTSHRVSEGLGPVNAIDRALREALLPWYPQIEEVRLADYKVRILDPENATGATTRVVVEAARGEERWSTVGCSDNIIEASCEALIDSFELFLLRNPNKVETPQRQEVVA